MGMRILYIVLGLEKSVGVQRKLQSQIDAFRLLGNEVDVCRIEKKGISLVTEQGARHFKEFRLRFLDKIALFYFFSRNIEKGRFICSIPSLSGHGYDMTYTRKYPYNKSYIRAIQYLRKNYGTTIVEEIATYPYDSEQKYFKNLISFIMSKADRYYRKSGRSGVDLYSCVCEESTIFGVPCIPIMNGYTFQDNPDVHPNRTADGGLHIVTLSTMKPWHGYDRLINGMIQYYRNEFNSSAECRVILHMIGDGPCCKDWKQLCEVGGISDYVVFHGLLGGNELEQLLSDCDIAVDSLGCHRKGLAASSALKVREYLAHGLPILYSSYDAITIGIQEYCMPIPPDESPVDISSVISFYRSLGSWERYYSILRQYTADRCSWTVQLNKVIESASRQREG